MTCRAPNSATTCVRTQTGQQMSYDGERRLVHWQSSPSSPSSSADYLYDGSGNRVEQVDTTGSTSSKGYYLLGGVEEVATTGSTSTLTKYYSAAGLLIGVNVGGTISYLASDGLGTVSEAFDGAGNVTAAQLYWPYGLLRYSSGMMPTTKGYTGQRADTSTSGLDYYNARYYDPAIGQFASADTQEGPNRYAYVAGNPETLTDPTGHMSCLDPPCDGSGRNYGSGPDSDESYAAWQVEVMRRRLQGTTYIPLNISRGTRAKKADDIVMDAAHDVADRQNRIGGQGGRVQTVGEGVLEFYYKDDSGAWQLMNVQMTDFWYSQGDALHAEKLIFNGEGGRTVMSILRAWLAQIGPHDASRWRVDIRIITGYPTCSTCQRTEAPAFYNQLSNLLGNEQGASFTMGLYGLYVKSPTETVLNRYTPVYGITVKGITPDTPFYPPDWLIP